MITPMDDVVRCPGCEANLTLPSDATGQTVQCPRCQNLFDVHRPVSSITASVVVPPPDAREPDDELLNDQRPICFPDAISGKRKAICAISLLSICMISF